MHNLLGPRVGTYTKQARSDRRRAVYSTPEALLVADYTSLTDQVGARENSNDAELSPYRCTGGLLAPLLLSLLKEQREKSG